MKEEKNKNIFLVKKDGKNFCSLIIHPFTDLYLVREEIIKKKKFSNFLFFDKENSVPIEIEKENELILAEIAFDDNNLEIKTNKNAIADPSFNSDLIDINVYLNNNIFYQGKISINETMNNFLNNFSNKIPYDAKIIFDRKEINVNEINEINEILDENNNIYFITTKQKIIINCGKKSIIEKLNVSLNLKELRKKLIKKNFTNFKFIDKNDNNDISLDQSIENDLIIDEIIVNKGNSKYIFIKPNIEEIKTEIINFFNKNNELFKKKLNPDLNLSEIRNNIQNEIKEDFLFLKNNQIFEIEKNNEFNYKLNEIKDSNNNVYISFIIIQIKFKINVQEAFVIKSNKNISLFDLRKECKEIPENLKFLSNNCIIKDERKFLVKDILVNNEFIELKNEEMFETQSSFFFQKEVENTQMKYKIYLNGKFLKFLKQFKNATLDDIRYILSQQISNNELFFKSNDEEISLEDEDQWTLEDYCGGDNKINLKTIKSESDLKVEEEKIIIKNTPINGSTLISESDGLKIYKYPKIIFSEKEKLNCKTIMVVGQTGSGKSTLLNSLLNFLMGIQLEDDFRYKIIIEDDKLVPGGSITSEVNIYNIRTNSNEIPNIRIVDTPGFGDTRGLDYDSKIIDMIKDTFKKECDVITAICFVAKSTETRLTTFQKYIISNVMSLFGNDVGENFIAMLTFCDGNKPNIINHLQDKSSIFGQLIDKIQDPWYLTFNNSAIFGSIQTKYTKNFWDLGMDSFKVFLRKLMMLDEKSLKLSKDVLDLRKQLQTTILGLRPQLDQGLQIMENIKKEINIIETNKDKINQCKNFNYKYKKPDIKKKDLPQGEHTTTCIICNYTCHYPCKIPDNNHKSKCSAMKNGKCKVCKNKCEWNEHKNLPYIIEYKEIEEIRSSEELKKKYFDSQSKLSASEQILNNLNEEYNNILVDCYKKSEDIKKAVEELKKISLYVNPNEDYEEYIKFCIQNEENDKKNGYLDRIKGYKKLLDIHSRINKAFHNQNIFDDFEKFKNEVILKKIKLYL